MLVLFAVLNHLLVALQNPSLFGQNGLILHPNRTQKRTATPPCGGMWSPSRSLPSFILHPSPVPCGYPSSLLFMWGFGGVSS
jgi:hypothetical protein